MWNLIVPVGSELNEGLGSRDINCPFRELAIQESQACSESIDDQDAVPEDLRGRLSLGFDSAERC